METTSILPMTKKDYYLSFLAGLFIGFLLLPILYAAKPELYEKFSIFIVPFFIIATPFGLAITHIIGQRIAVIWQIGKFGVTGVLNFCVDLGVLSLLTFIMGKYFEVGSGDLIFSSVTFFTFYSIYKSISFITANINSYIWNKYWTFQKEDDKKSEFFQFFIVSIIGFVINVFFASIVFKYVSPVAGLNLEQWGLMGAVVGSIAGLIWNFLGYKFIVFKK